MEGAKKGADSVKEQISRLNRGKWFILILLPVLDWSLRFLLTSGKNTGTAIRLMNL